MSQKDPSIIPRVHNPFEYDYELSPDGSMRPGEMRRAMMQRHQERQDARAAEELRKLQEERADLGRKLNAIGRGI